MIKDAIEFLQARLETTNLFSKVWGLCELINKDGKTYPAYYNGNGDYTDVSQFNRYDGSAYFRMLSDVTMTEVEDAFITTSCGALLQYELSVKLVCVVKRDKLDCDDAYGAHTFAQMITKVMDSPAGLGVALNASFADSTVKRYSTSGHDILIQEYKNPSVNEFDTNYVYLSMDIDLTIIKDKTCIDEICY